MADHDFFFAVELSGRPVSLEMLRDLASRVLDQAGCRGDGGAVIEGLAAAIDESERRGASRCRLQFVARDGKLDVVVSADGDVPWRMSRDIP